MRTSSSARERRHRMGTHFLMGEDVVAASLDRERLRHRQCQRHPPAAVSPRRPSSHSNASCTRRPRATRCYGAANSVRCLRHPRALDARTRGRQLGRQGRATFCAHIAIVRVRPFGVNTEYRSQARPAVRRCNVRTVRAAEMDGCCCNLERISPCLVLFIFIRNCNKLWSEFR